MCMGATHPHPQTRWSHPRLRQRGASKWELRTPPLRTGRHTEDAQGHPSPNWVMDRGVGVGSSTAVSFAEKLTGWLVD